MTFGIQGTLWPIHTKPYDHEILSSWLSRVAYGHGLSLSQFLSVCLPRPVGIGSDIDLVTDQAFLAALVAGTGVRSDDAARTTFIPDEGKIYSGNDIFHLRWVVPLRLRSHPSYRIGLPFCPSCLATDAVPYYRKQWRYGFFPVCPTHGILKTKCPSCGHPYAYQGSDRGRQLELASGLPGYCRGCGTPFSIGHLAVDDLVSVVGNIQQRILNALQEGWIEVPNRGMVHIYSYLQGLRFLVTIFQKEVGCRIAAWIEEQAKVVLPWDSIVSFLPFENQFPRLRASALFLADWLVQEWPLRFIEMVEALEVNVSNLLPPPKERPHWLSDPAIEALGRGQQPLSEKEIEAARRMLIRQIQWPVSKSEAVKFMRSLSLPEIKPLRASPTIQSKLACMEVSTQLTAKYEWRKRLSRKIAQREPLLYQTFHQGPGIRKIERDIVEASEDIGSLWMALRANTSKKLDN